MADPTTDSSSERSTDVAKPTSAPGKESDAQDTEQTGKRHESWSEQHPGDPVVVFENVTLTSSGRTVLDDISFKVQGGETRILLGPAGVGKSVLLKLANGLILPNSGSIRIFGEEIGKLDQDQLFALRDHIGMVFQEGALFDSLTVRNNVAYRLTEAGVAEDEIDRRVREALRFVELEQTIDKFPSQLSGGMRRRVSIARAIINDPELVLYDSPTGGLDPITSTTIIELVIKQRDLYGSSSLLVSHRLQDAFTLATHRYNKETNHMEKLQNGEVDSSTSFLVLHEGKMVFDGTTEDLVHSEDPFIQSYIR
jgi:phospholipid/cholesterol/gamma-HCH transport system ATP-binding protein